MRVGQKVASHAKCISMQLHVVKVILDELIIHLIFPKHVLITRLLLVAWKDHFANATTRSSMMEVIGRDTPRFSLNFASLSSQQPDFLARLT